MATSRGRSDDGPAARLGIEDWLQAGFAILSEQGIKALKVDSLCARLGVTKGSFYWHFTGMPGYRSALVSSWGELRDGDRRDFEELGVLPPRERLTRMMASLVSPAHWTLERAMREWARTDESVAAGVRAADRRVLRAVRDAFVDFGFDDEEADVRANATFAAGIGLLHLSGSAPAPRNAAQAERFLDLMLAR